ncbi:MAG TPA: SLBB domain-containing protein [Candidatus Binatia bacterium]|jgi:protein involved in polysaccharide export with SLBB domain|nr:SLBB domain-containing protein [Candidatus Binatia bacterium]
MIKASRFLWRWGAVGGLLLAALFLAGCFLSRGGSDPRFAELPGVTGPENAPATTTPVVNNPGAPAGNPDTTLGATEVLQPGEAIIVTFSDTPMPIPAWNDAIKADGTITLMLNMTFTAAGKTRRQLEEEIRSRYVPAYYQTMTPSVIRQQSTRFYYVLGDVKAPGRQVYIDRMTVLKAISSCGDFTDFAKKTKVRLTRGDGRIFIINCKKALKHPELDLEVFPGDKVYVPRRIF